MDFIVDVKMPSKVKVQVCGHCGRGIKGHTLPFGVKKCKLQPLEPSERVIELKKLTDEVTTMVILQI